MQEVAFLLYLLGEIIGETEMFGKNACVVLWFNDNQILM